MNQNDKHVSLDVSLSGNPTTDTVALIEAADRLLTNAYDTFVRGCGGLASTSDNELTVSKNFTPTRHRLADLIGHVLTVGFERGDIVAAPNATEMQARFENVRRGG